MDKRKKIEWYKNYLGKQYWEYFKELRQEEDLKTWNKFKGLNIDCNQSYYVQSRDYSLLNKFVCFYLIQKYRGFTTQDAYSFANILTQHNLEEYVNSELIIINYHKNTMDMGETVTWLSNTILCKVGERNRQNDLTLFLAEKENVMIKNSGEFKILNLDSIGINTGKSQNINRHDEGDK